MSEYVTPDDLCKEFHISRKNLSRMIAKGLRQAPLIPGGHKSVIFREDLREYLNRNAREITDIG